MKELKEVKSAFVKPKKKWYFGKIIIGTPYFNPINYCQSLIYIRKLKLRSEKELKEYIRHHPYAKPESDNYKYSNLPMVRRSYFKIIKIFNKHYFIEWGWPIMFKKISLGWKWKYDDVRYEWPPMYQFWFFKWQIILSFHAPDNNDDLYYEMILHYLKKCDMNLRKAKKSWGWVDYKTKKSTWNKNYILKYDTGKNNI